MVPLLLPPLFTLTNSYHSVLLLLLLLTATDTDLLIVTSLTMDLKKILIILGGIFAAIIIAAISGVFLWGVYLQRWDTPITRAVASVISVPVARVGEISIPLDRYYRDVDSLKSYYNSEEAKAAGLSGNQFGDLERKQALERLIEEAAILEMALEKKITLTNEEIEKAIDAQFVSPSSTRQELEENIQRTYGWTMFDFREHIVRPILLERKLAELENPTDPQTGMTAVITKLSERIQRPDVVRYIKFEEGQ